MLAKDTIEQSDLEQSGLDFHCVIRPDCPKIDHKGMTFDLRKWSQSSGSSWKAKLSGIPVWNTGLPPCFGGSNPPAIMPPFHSRKYT